MNKETIDKIIKGIMDFLGKNVPKEVAKPVQHIVVQPVPVAPAQETPKPSIEPLTKDDLLMGRDKTHASEYTAEVSENLDKLLIVINKIQDLYGKKMKVNSGWRPAGINASIAGAAKKSNHMLGLAVDIGDADGEVMKWVLSNLDKMKEIGVYLEDWRHTPTWTHFQIIPPKSGNRIFIPSSAPAPAPNRWIGKYSAKYN